MGMNTMGMQERSSRRTTANPNDLFDLLHDLADESCLSIGSEDIHHNDQSSSHQVVSQQQQVHTSHSLNITSTNISYNKSTKTNARNNNSSKKPINKPTITRRKTFDGVITDSFLIENDTSSSIDEAEGLEDSDAAGSYKVVVPDRRATLDPSELLLSVYHDIHMQHNDCDQQSKASGSLLIIHISIY